MKKKNSTDKQFANIQDGLGKTEQFVENNRFWLFSIISLLIVIFIGYYLYQSFYKEPLNKTAQNQLFIGEQYFEKDSFKVALNGKDNFEGFISISENYSNTPSGELAKYYAGISYLRIGEYEKAITQLDNFDCDDELLMSIATTAIGDAFSEINQPKEAIEYYEKAIKMTTNHVTTPIILMKCARLHELEKNYNDAIECYETIKTDYPQSTLTDNIDKYINAINQN